MRLALWPLFLVLLSLPAWGWDSSISVPPAAPVVDGLGILQPGEVSQLEDLLRTIKAKSGVEISVYITPSLEGRAIEDYSIAVTDKWQLGRKKEDKGLLFLIAPKERKMRFEVGYGLEGDITDAFSRRVLDDTVRPLFRDGRYFDGIVAGIARLQEKIPLGLSEADLPEQPGPAQVSLPLLLVFLFFLFVFVFPMLGLILGLGRRGYIGRSRTYWGGGGWGGGGWGGGGFGGGSWGGGGGGFGGGGSSSSW